MPCSTVNVESKYLYEGERGDIPSISLVFSEDVQVFKTEFLTFNFMIFLSDIGGSMGLWLGIGLLQVLETTISCILRQIRK